MLKYRIFVCGKNNCMSLYQWDNSYNGVFNTIEETAESMRIWKITGDLEILPDGFFYVILPVFVIE